MEQIVTYSDQDIIEALARGANDKEAAEACGGDWIRVGPLSPEQIQPASIDLCLGTEFVCLTAAPSVDMRDRAVPSYPVSIGAGKDSYFELKPHELVLATTIERVELGPRICAKIEGKSSLGRLGLVVHVTAGFIDPGFRGQLTLELYNIGPSPIRLRPGLAICQVAFGECKTTARKPYGSPGLGSRYQDQAGAVPVRP